MKYKVYIVFGVFILLVLFSIYGTARFMQITSTPKYCGSCHVMIPQYEDWFYIGKHTQITCVDCHLPHNNSLNYILWKGLDGAKDEFKISDHNVMSPLKDDLFACLKCHPQSKERLVKQVKEIQDRTLSLLLKAGYHEAVVAKLFERVHSQYKDTLAGDPLYVQAKDFYLEALYRLIFMGAENSIGFHNPEEAGRILGDSIGFSTKAEGLLRQLLAKKGVDVGNTINLELAKYLNNRGEHKLMFKRDQEFKDPFGIVEKTVPRNSLGL